MRLFKITETYELEVEPWVLMVPEFNLLFKRDKGSPGDYRGDRKLKAKKLLGYIYMCLDFTSPIKEWDEIPKREEALRYQGLVPEDIDDKVLEAWDVYEELLLQSAPSLKTLRSIKKGQDALNKYFEEVDFDKKDKLGKAFYTPESYITNIAKLPLMNKAIKEYERAVEAELKEGSGVRGKNATLGRKEGKRRDIVWREGGPPEGDSESAELQTTEL